jgi:DNA-binding Xre family transcriptional regulator
MVKRKITYKTLFRKLELEEANADILKTTELI